MCVCARVRSTLLEPSINIYTRIWVDLLLKLLDIKLNQTITKSDSNIIHRIDQSRVHQTTNLTCLHSLAKQTIYIVQNQSADQTMTSNI